MPGRVTLFIAAVVFALSGAVHAFDAENPIPEHIAGYVSVKSPMKTLAALDGYVANATAGTGSAVPPGLLTMLASIALPVPLDSWEVENDVQVIVSANAFSSKSPVTVLFRVADFDQFLKSLESKKWRVEEGEAGSGSVPLREAVMPNGAKAVFADLGNGLAAVADSAERIEQDLADGDWIPEHDDENADIYAYFAMNRDGVSVIEKVAESLREKEDAIAQAISTHGFKPEVAKGVAALMEKYIPQFVGEMEKARFLYIGMWMEEDKLVTDFDVAFDKDSLPAEIANKAEEAPELDLKLAGRFPAEAAWVSVSASQLDLIDNARERFASLTEDIYENICPDLAKRAGELVEAYYRSGPGQSGVAVVLAGERQNALNLIAAEDPDAMLNVFSDSIALLNDLWSASIDEPRLTARLEEEGKGGNHRIYRPVFGEGGAEEFQRFLHDLVGDNEELRAGLTINADYRIHVARVNGAIAMGMGELDEEEFAAYLSVLESGPESPLIELPDSAWLLENMAEPRIGAVVMNADRVFRMVIANALVSTDQRLPKGKVNPLRLAFNAMQPRDSEEVFGFSFDGYNSILNCRFILPAAAVGVFVGNYEEFERVLKAGGGAAAASYSVPSRGN